jgi:hypothetical protein
MANVEERSDQPVQEGGQRPGSTVSDMPQSGSNESWSTAVAPETRQCLAALVTNIGACRRWLSADPPNSRQALATIERMTGNVNVLTRLVSTSWHDDHGQRAETEDLLR